MKGILAQALMNLSQDNSAKNSLTFEVNVNGKIVRGKLKTKLSKKKKKQLKKAEKERKESAKQVDPIMVLQKQMSELSADVKKLKKKSFKKKR